MRRTIIYIVTIVGLVLGGCVQNMDDIVVDRNRFFEPMVTDVIGILLDENDLPIPDATVQTGSLFTRSDENGVFILSNVVINKNGQLVWCEKDGYFSNWAYIVSEESSLVQVEVVLKEKLSTIRFNSSDGGQFQPFPDLSLRIPDNAFLDRTGSEYFGVVNLDVHYSTPGECYLPIENVIVRNEDQSPRVIAGGKALQIEVRSQGGSKLTLRKNLEVIFVGQNAPLGHVWAPNFDDQSFRPISESNNSIPLSSTGTFLLGASTPSSKLVGTVYSALGQHPHTTVEIQSLNGCTEVITNSNGQFAVYTPSDGEVTVIAHQLDQPVSKVTSAAIGSGMEYNLDLEVESSVNTTLTTELLACGNETVPNSYLMINGVLPVYTNTGKIEVKVSAPLDSIHIRGKDRINDQKSMSFTINLDDDMISLPGIKCCDAASGQYITYRLNGLRVWSDKVQAGFIGKDLQVLANLAAFQNPHNFQDVFIEVSNLETSPLLLNFELFLDVNDQVLHGKCVGNCKTPNLFEIVEMGSDIGDFISGKISGEIESFSPGTTYEYSCEFSVKRTF